MNRLARAASPYLLAHAGDPVDWWPWGPAAFAEAVRRDVPVMISIGYSTCHWCHVMHRESFADPGFAAVLNPRFVAVKVDREEHPDVDAAYLTEAGAFTPHLGWPLTLFATPSGRVFHAGTYFPPVPSPGHPSLRQVLDAVDEAWRHDRAEVVRSADGLAAAIADAARTLPPETALVPARIVDDLAANEDPDHGGFGGAPKFPVAPALVLLQSLAGSPLLDPERRSVAAGVASRALAAIAAGGLRDPVDGGVFRYATRSDWTVPHYERMLTDNAVLLDAFAAAGDRRTAAGVVAFLDGVLGLDSGAFGAAQDSESDVGGRRSEGGYYALDADARAAEPRPGVDRKVLSGWNGFAIGALARAGERLGEPAWIARAARAADAVLAVNRAGGRLVRATLDGAPSPAPATLEDVGGLAGGLLAVALAAGRVDLAVVARDLVDGVLRPDGALVAAGDPVLAAAGLAAGPDLAEGSTPSGPSAVAAAARTLYLLTGEDRYRAAAHRALAPLVAAGSDRPLAAGAALAAALAAAEPVRQVVVVGQDAALAAAARRLRASITAVVPEPVAVAFADAGFELFAGRTAQGAAAAAYVCEDFACLLPVTRAEDLPAR